MSCARTIRASLVILAAVASMWLLAGPVWASESLPFGIEKFENSFVALNEKGEPVPATQAGSHPYAMTTTIVFFHKEPSETERDEGWFGDIPTGDPRNVELQLPTGVVVNPTATLRKCAEAELESVAGCPAAAAVGVVSVKIGFLGLEATDPVYNMIPPAGTPAEFAFPVAGLEGVDAHIVGGVHTGGDYGLLANVLDISQKAAIYSAAVTLWGDPSTDSHDEERGKCAETSPAAKMEHREEYEAVAKEAVERGEIPPTESAFFKKEEYFVSCPVERAERALLSMPSSCTGQPLSATVSADLWQEPENVQKQRAISPAVTGCNVLGFGPSLSVLPFEPATPATESPAGLEVDLKLPQEAGLEQPGVLARSDLKEATVALPAGVTVSPSAANGLDVCSLLVGNEKGKEEAEARGELAGINFESRQPANCPDASKLGTVEVTTPLLERPLNGSVYIAQQGNLAGNGSNPFGSLLALYLVAEGSGVVIKLPGEIELNAASGQLTARFGEDPLTGFYLPQLPFGELKMRLFGGPRAPLVTPPLCGAYAVASRLTPWDGNAAPEPGSSFTISSGCDARGFSPTLAVGTTNNQAGDFSAETVTIARDDGEQNLSGITVTTPPGLLGMLSKVPLCQEPQASQGTCSEASKIGETTELVGPGSDPYAVRGGRVYLTGSYKGAPFGLSIVVPTVAGPFTLKGNGGFGREIVRASIAVNPQTGAVTIVSDPLPNMLEGVPLDIRTVDVEINRPGFAFNPTNCEELHATSTITSLQGATASPSSRFEAANCAALPFKPTLSASTQTHAHRLTGASLTVKVAQKPGEANIRKVDLQLPTKLPARLATLRKACTEAQFAANPAGCPPESVIGEGSAVTPVLNVPLTGPVYIVSHGGAAYPDVVFVLQGAGVTIDLTGGTRIKGDFTFSKFETVPDAPISFFEARLPEGPHSVLTSNLPATAHEDFCGRSLTMPTTITAQSGAQVTQSTKVAVAGCPKKRKQMRHKDERKSK